MRTVLLRVALLLSVTAQGCHERNDGAKAQSPMAPSATLSDAAVSRQPDAASPDATAIPWEPIPMTFATRLKKTAVVDRLDPKTSSRRCLVTASCKPFVPLVRCPAGIAPIDASKLRAFAPPEPGATISVRGPLGLAQTTTTANLCLQKAGRPYNCCRGVSIRAFVGDVPDGVRLDGIGCGGDESRLCCTVPAFGQVVVATGKIVPESDPGLVLRGSRWALAEARLCSVD